VQHIQRREEDAGVAIGMRDGKVRVLMAPYMFIIELIYKAELTLIDAHMKAHVKFLRKYYAAGNFLISGRKVPRDGGIIVAVGESRQQIEAIAAEDPFCTHGLADVRIVEFRASQRADDLPKRIA
jgi:uncharacterized protein YciI